jgi:hypothetical protein
MHIHIAVHVTVMQNMNFYTDSMNLHQNAGSQELYAVVVLTA